MTNMTTHNKRGQIEWQRQIYRLTMTKSRQYWHLQLHPTIDRVQYHIDHSCCSHCAYCHVWHSCMLLFFLMSSCVSLVCWPIPMYSTFMDFHNIYTWRPMSKSANGFCVWYVLHLFTSMAPKVIQLATYSALSHQTWQNGVQAGRCDCVSTAPWSCLGVLAGDP